MISDTYCVLPWISVNIDTEGKFGLCCIKQNILKDDNGKELTVEDWKDVQSCKTLRDVRQQMLEGKQPKECSRCFELEKSSPTVMSYRKVSNKRFKEFIQLDQTNLSIKHLDLRLGNVCNLACRMCSNHSSSKWNKEQRILSQKLNFVNYSEISNDWTKSQSVTDFIDSHVSTLKDLRFAGGEPTYQSMPIKIMKRLIDIGVSKDIDLKLNVNLTHITEDAINTWSKFRSVRIMASLDGVRELNTYIRYPGDWNTVINNLQILTALNHEKQLDLQVLSTIQVYNAFDMLNIEELMSNLRIKEKHAFTPVWNPSYLNVQCIPEQLKEKILLRYPNPSSQVKKILDFMMYQQLNNWEQFKQFTLAVDSNRNQNVLDFVPELKGYL